MSMNEHGYAGVDFGDSETASAYRHAEERARTKANGGSAAAAEAPTPISPKWPDPLTEAALYGLAGEYVGVVNQASEADDAALLLQFLVAFGNVIGHEAYFSVEDAQHHLHLYCVLVGQTAKSRKGTSWSRAKKLFSLFAPHWVSTCVGDGLSSGEGLIEAVRDPAEVKDKKGDVRIIPGADDKRLLVCQGEFCSVLHMLERAGNTLGGVLRNAWDGDILSTLTRKDNSLRATDAHISMIGHITLPELRRLLTETDKANGFGNRILWTCVARSKELPDGAEISPQVMNELAKKVEAAVSFASNVGRIQRSEGARELWHAVYHDLSEGQPGMFGAVTSRAEAQVVRLSCVYAVLDSSKVVEVQHLQAALAVWKYCEDSARYIFGDALGDPVADEILAAIKASADGLTRNDLMELFGRNKSSARIGQALTVPARARQGQDAEGDNRRTAAGGLVCCVGFTR